jgi:hypothetical protein
MDAKLLAVGSDGLVLLYDLAADKKFTYEPGGINIFLRYFDSQWIAT